MKDVNFGLGVQVPGDNDRKDPSVALRLNTILATWGQGSDLRYRLGTPQHGTVQWSADGLLESNAEQTSCALAHNTPGQAGNLFGVEAHKAPGKTNKIFTTVGRVDGAAVNWRAPIEFADGVEPAVAVNDGLFAVVVYRDATDNTLRGRVGAVSIVRGDEKLTWPVGVTDNDTQFGVGAQPSVAIDGANRVVLAWQTTGTSPVIHVRVGRIRNNAIRDLGAIQPAPAGNHPEIALQDDGTVILVYRDHAGELHHRVGSLDTPQIFPPVTDPRLDNNFTFEKGLHPSVATNGRLAVQLHQASDRLVYSTSLVIDRGSWMRDHLTALGARNLSQLVLPASHDAGMYKIVRHDPTKAAQAQDLRIYRQLTNGIRYFDLRPQWDEKTLSFNIFHDIFGNGDTIGPPLAEVLDDVKTFLTHHRELVILKFSHYSHFDVAATQSGDPATATDTEAQRGNKRYGSLVTQIALSLAPFLYQNKPAATRLADLSVATILAGSTTHGVALVVCDGDFPVHNRTIGIYIYRDTGTPDIEAPLTDPKGDLRVYDRYYQTTGNHYDGLKDDQKDKFKDYKGEDDLFLLSWTLTPLPTVTPPHATVLNVSPAANSRLAAGITEFPKNTHGQIVNLIFVNYVEFSRVTDVCLYRNGVA